LTTPKPRLHGNRLSGAARAGSRAAVNGVTSRRRRQRVCSKDRASERGEREEKGEEGRGEAGVRLLLEVEVRSALHRRALTPIHHLSCQASVRGVMRNVHSCGSERKTGRKWKNPIAPDVDTDCSSSRLY